MDSDYPSYLQPDKQKGFMQPGVLPFAIYLYVTCVYL